MIELEFWDITIMYFYLKNQNILVTCKLVMLLQFTYIIRSDLFEAQFFEHLATNFFCRYRQNGHRDFQFSIRLWRWGSPLITHHITHPPICLWLFSNGPVSINLDINGISGYTEPIILLKYICLRWLSSALVEVLSSIIFVKCLGLGCVCSLLCRLRSGSNLYLSKQN